MILVESCLSYSSLIRLSTSITTQLMFHPGLQTVAGISQISCTSREPFLFRLDLALFRPHVLSSVGSCSFTKRLLWNGNGELEKSTNCDRRYQCCHLVCFGHLKLTVDFLSPGSLNGRVIFAGHCPEHACTCKAISSLELKVLNEDGVRAQF